MRATAGSPIHPSASAASVTPNCTAGRKSFIERFNCISVLAPGRPSAINCCTLVSRMLTKANSAATKKLLARIKKATMIPCISVDSSMRPFYPTARNANIRRGRAASLDPSEIHAQSLTR